MSTAYAFALQGNESGMSMEGAGRASLSYVDEEIVTPEQFFGRSVDSSEAWTGERKLLFAVLSEAFSSYCRYLNNFSVRGRRLYRETQDWFDSTDKSWLYSFENICDHLDLDPGYVRLGLKRWKQQHGLPEPPNLPRRRGQRVNNHLKLVGGTDGTQGG